MLKLYVTYINFELDIAEICQRQLKYNLLKALFLLVFIVCKRFFNTVSVLQT